MAGKFAILFLLLFAICLPGSSQTISSQPMSHPERAQGTVNIFLAEGGSLVAVTDSMLTYETTNQHVPNGRKLYKLDARTICAMAGSYSEGGPNNLENLALFLPEIAGYISQEMAKRGSSNVSFERRAGGIFYSFEFQLTSHLQAMAAANPAMKIDEAKPTVELTLAGYDNDGSLKLAEMTLAPRRTQSGVTLASVDRPHSSHVPNCESTAGSQKVPLLNWGNNFFVIRRVGNRLFCDVAGIPDVGRGSPNRSVPGSRRHELATVCPGRQIQ